MAIAPLEKRLEQLVQQEQTAPPDLKAESDALQEIASSPVELTPETQQFEPVQVAGPVSVFKTLKAAPKRTQVPIIRPGAQTEAVGPFQVVRDAEQQVAEDVLQAAPGMPAVGKPSPSEPGIPATVTNLFNINGPDELKQHIEAVGRAYGADKIQRMDFGQVRDEIVAKGYDEAFLARILNQAEVTQADPRDAYKMLLAVADAGKVAFDLGEQVKTAYAAGRLTPELAAEFRQAIAMEGVLLKAVRGRQTDIARTLGIFRVARETTGPQRGQLMEAILSEAGGIKSIHDLANSYTAIASKSARSMMAEKTTAGTIKDIWFTSWINGILSGPVTHAKNIAGSAAFGIYHSLLEMPMASVIGKTRNLIAPGGETAITFDEVGAMAFGMVRGVQEGAIIASKAFAKNEPSDALTKIQASRIGVDPFDIDLGDGTFGKAMSKGIRYYGSFVTVPGRALMAEDEFFKAWGYRMQLNALATRQSLAEYRKLVSQGVPDQQARQQAQGMMARILDPMTTPDDLDAAAKEFGRVITFQKELEPALQGIQQFLQNPLMKMFVPFVRTPTNIGLETLARTPAAFMSPRFTADFNAGGVRRDMAVAKATLGSSLIFGTAGYALEGKITGYGPMRVEDKKALEATGWQPFSFALNNEDISPELLEQFRKIATVSQGPKKTYISYAGLEPLSTLLAVGATAGEYSQMAPGDNDLEQMFMGGTMGLYNYLSEQPMLTGFGDLSDALTSNAKDFPSKLYDIMRTMTKQVTTVAIGGSPVGAYSSLIASVERYMNPEASLTMAEMMGGKESVLEGAERGFWEATRQAMSRNPLTSDKLPRQLDPITGEPRKVGNGNLYEMFSPFRKSDGKFSPAHTVLVELNIPMYTPTKTMDGVMLSASQYQRLIEIATMEVKSAGKTRFGMAGKSLEDAIVATTKSREFIREQATSLKVAQDLMRSEISWFYSEAKKRLIAEDPDLRMAIEDVKAAEAIEGKYKR